MPQFRSGTVLKKNIENCCLGSSSQSGFRSKRACAVILLPYSSMLCHPPRSRFLRTGNGVDVCRYTVYQSIGVLNSIARKCLIFSSKVWKLHPLKIVLWRSQTWFFWHFWSLSNLEGTLACVFPLEIDVKNIPEHWRLLLYLSLAMDSWVISCGKKHPSSVWFILFVYIFMWKMAFKNPSFHIEFHLHKLASATRVMPFLSFPPPCSFSQLYQIEWKSSASLINETLFSKDTVWGKILSFSFLRPFHERLPYLALVLMTDRGVFF